MSWFTVCVLLILKHFHGIRHSDAMFTAVNNSRKYTRISSDILSNSSYGLASYGWTLISRRTKCAIKSISKCPGSRGFLYNPGTEICTQLVWLHVGMGGSTLDTSDVQQWELFVTKGLCSEGFEAHDYGSRGHFSCLKRLNEAATYLEASTQCNNSGGYLASVKTRDKLEMILGITGKVGHWVGMDDRGEEGMFRWQEDNQVLTLEQQLAVFEPREPNKANPDGNCVRINGFTGRLFGTSCASRVYSLCETASVSVRC